MEGYLLTECLFTVYASWPCNSMQQLISPGLSNISYFQVFVIVNIANIYSRDIIALWARDHLNLKTLYYNIGNIYNHVQGAKAHLKCNTIDYNICNIDNNQYYCMGNG